MGMYNDYNKKMVKINNYKVVTAVVLATLMNFARKNLFIYLQKSIYLFIRR